ncbi:MAG: hypothetical protein DCF31_11095 [Alphaproteobacteria bacterium]|nr:MAG: hypothetical protein DCF31_11095 [Alphaproteobacteria bacterium]
MEAERLTEQQIEAKARDFIRDVLPIPAYGQYARWTQPVCPKVAGIADVYAAMVETRVRAAATAAGVPLAPPGCRTNLSITFSEDARVTAGIIARRKPRLVAKLDGLQQDRLFNAALPVRWWHVSEPTDDNGLPATSATVLMTTQTFGGQSLAESLPINPDTIMTGSYNSSLIDTNLKIGVTGAVVLVDIPLATGKPLDAVADYVALVALAPAKLPPELPGVPSILGLFGSNGGAAALTGWDKAYLAALYRIQLNRNANRQRGQLVGAIKASFAPD